MTQQEQQEIIQRSFPNVGETEIRKRLNDANKYFIRESRIIQDVGTTTITSDTTDYAFSLFTTSGGGELIEVYDVAIPDISTDELVWKVERNRNTIVVGKLEENSSDKKVIKSLTDTGETIYVYGVYSDPGYGTTLTDEPAYDEEFHMGIVYKVLADLNLERGEIAINDRWEAKYKRVEISAKKAAGSAGVKGGYRTWKSIGDSPRQIG